MPERKAISRESKRDAMLAVIGLLGAILGSGATYLAAHEAVESSLRQQVSQLSEQRVQAAREKRGATYSSLLDNSLEYAAAAVAVQDNSDRVLHDLRQRSDSPLIATVATAQARFQRSLGDVFVYGSSAGVDQAERLAGVFGTSVGHVYLSGADYRQGFDRVRFQEEYRSFQKLMCREVAAVPRGDC